MKGPPLKDAVVVIEGTSIKAVLSRNSFKKEFPATILHDYGEAIILPGLINLHTHLDYSSLPLSAVNSGFIGWIEELIESSSSWSKEDWQRSALRGALEVACSGTSLVVDSSYTGQAAWALAEVGLRGVVGLELFGIEEDKAEASWQGWLQKKASFEKAASNKLKKSLADGLITLTVAPHAPYTVCPALWSRALDWAKDNDLPVLAHLAESEEEHRWIAQNDELLSSFIYQMFSKDRVHFNPQLTWRGNGLSPTEHLENYGLLSKQLLAAHAIHLTHSDMSLLAKRKVKVVHCPRSNTHLHNRFAKLYSLLEAGIQVGLGTDSKASVADLSPLTEARYAFQLASSLNPTCTLDAQQVIHLLTLKAAELLGLENTIGSLETGKQADIAVFAIDDNNSANGCPYGMLLWRKPRLLDLLVAGNRIVKIPAY